MSFSETSPDDKLGYLHLNKVNNVDERFKLLNYVNADDNSMTNKEQGDLREYLLSITMNNTSLFIRVE